MEDQSDELRARIGREMRPGETATYQRWLGALAMTGGTDCLAPQILNRQLPSKPLNANSFP